MTDLIHINPGNRPWSPTGAEDEIVRLDEYNIPLAGLINQGGHIYLYVCAAGEEEDANVWLYANLEDAEVKDLRKSRGREVVTTMMKTLQNRTVTAALAQDCGLVMWDNFDAGTESPGVLVSRFLQRLTARLKLTNDNIDHLKRDPSIDADDAQLSMSVSP